MGQEKTIADHWGSVDVYAKILEAFEKAGKSMESLTVEDLAPVDHFHARGFPATVELGDRLPVEENHHLLDIGSGLGGPARYFAARFKCRVSGVDLTPAFVEAADKLNTLVGIGAHVDFKQGDGQQLPYSDSAFDGAYTQHVTMNVADRPRFFGEAWRVLKPGAFFAITEHGLGAAGDPHHPVPWSMDGTGAYLMSPSDTRDILEETGFEDIQMEDTGPKYLAGYRHMMELASKNELPPLGIHILMGDSVRDKICNAARNIEEGRTHPVMVFCRKPS